MIINSITSSINTPNAFQKYQPAAKPAAPDNTDIVPEASGDRLYILNRKTTILENLSANSSLTATGDMAEGLLKALRLDIGGGAADAVQAQTGGISAQSARLLEE